MSDSDSAPEDVTFEAARASALNQMQDAAKAIEEQREKNKTARKRKIEFLKEQKEKKMQRLQELEKNKLPAIFLEAMNSSEPTEPKCTNIENGTSNTRTVFTADLDEEDKAERKRKKALKKLKKQKEKVIQTKSTEFNIVTDKDLSSQKYVNQEAWTFRENMLYGSGRVNREPHKYKKMRDIKRKAVGRHLAHFAYKKPI